MSQRFAQPWFGYDTEGKAIRHVRTPEGAAFYDLPIGSPIVGHEHGHHAPSVARKKPAQRATGLSRVRDRAATVGAAKKPSAVRKKPPATDGGRLNSNIALQTHIGEGGLQRSWGPLADNQHIRNRNVDTGNNKIEYGTPVELARTRKTAIDKAKAVPKPETWDIADNKRLFAASRSGDISEALRGDKYQRQANAWQVYIDFGGVDAKGKDKGYVLCVGCGVKMTWHSNRAFSKYPKFELDKIIVGADGGQYVPQNLVPLCSACNKQRGNKRMWESKVFARSKPAWYNGAYVARVATTKPAPRNLALGQGRPAKPKPKYPMPVPPGEVRTRS